MGRTTIDFGIDLGTTNSSVAVMNDGQVQVVRNSDGAEVTPSVVRVAADGAVTVGRRAKQTLELDPDNTRAEFKRIMGTTEAWRFPKSGRELGPEALSAEVLKSLRADVRDQLGEEMAAAVITVPALFEIPQCEATGRAGKLAGLDVAPLLQEPIASAIACGYRGPTDVRGTWVVYDLGGGTFDTSVLLTRDGRMQVVDHDGDNFLGGKDFDWLIVDWAAKHLRDDGLMGFDRSSTDPAVRRAFAKLKATAEDVKILLSRAEKAPFQIDALMDGVDLSLTLTRRDFEQMIESRVAKSVELVQRLIERNRLSSRAIEKLIFVGGPTLTPMLRAAVEDALGVKGEAGVDPLTIVAQGAAIHAATQRLESTALVAVPRGTWRVKLEYPPISQDAEPFVVGRVSTGDANDRRAVAAVEIDAVDGSFRSGRVPVNARGGFTVSVRLHKKGSTKFLVRAVDERGDAVAVSPDGFSISYGMVVSEPPLSRSVGVATADNNMRFYITKGSSLPARRTFTHKTVQPLNIGESGEILAVPVVQGESLRADRNRHIGTLEIHADNLRRTLPAGTEVEVTIEVDASGSVRAQAYVPLADQVFEKIVTIATPIADPERLAETLWAERARLSKARRAAADLGATAAVGLSRDLDDAVIELEIAIDAAKGGDTDAAQQAVRRLLDLQMRVDDVEAALKWPEVEKEVDRALARARMAVISAGQEIEREHFERLQAEVVTAREKRDVHAVEWKGDELHQLAWAIESRDPATWMAEFDYLASTPSRFTDGEAAHRLIEAGQKIRGHESGGKIDELKQTVRSLWKLLPADEQDRVKGFGSGVR
ncbi:MAG: Hsp70 family protein [Deltaproteobacteria bacterium]|nr:Hsp70 family protein [Deltaproteobacteria bacterium]